MLRVLISSALVSLGLLGPALPEEAQRVLPALHTIAASKEADRTARGELIFADEFDGAQIDPTRWTTCYWWETDGCTNEGNQELAWYQPGNVLVDGGVLRLRAQAQPIETAAGTSYPYTSGMITTGRDTSRLAVPPRFTFRYGTAQVRARLPRGAGLWPAFWLLPATHRSKPEIDVLEMLGHDPARVHLGLHYLDAQGEADRFSTSWRGPDLSAGWHTFTIDWQPHLLVWSVDGVERLRYSEPAHIPHEPMYLIINLAVGGEWPGPPDEATVFPSDYVVDFVRVWGYGELVELTPTADATVEQEEPTVNFGSAITLHVDQKPVRITYLQFDTRPLAGHTLTAAQLRIHTVAETGAGSGHAQTVWLLEDAVWDEESITFAHRPPLSTQALGVLRGSTAHGRYSLYLDLPPLEAQLGRLITLAVATDGDDGMDFYAREAGATAPRLILTTIAAQTSTQESSRP
jgi:beta-glucanase (GH16 family)